MEGGVSAKQVARYVALGALFLIPLTPLLVANSYFFPFITGKAFYFRILVEIAVAAWGALAFLDADYRPRFSWVGVAVVAFVAWMFIADLFAVNVAKAFWSNFERMEGWVLLVHLFGLFFAASAVLRVEQKWRAWFQTAFSVSLIISAYALLQLGGSLAIHQGSARIDATLGNSAYLAIYFLFNVCIAAWLSLTEKRVWLRWLLAGGALLETILIFFTETRGTIIALVLAGALAAFLTMLTAGKRVRAWATGAFLCILILVGGFYLARNTSFVQQNSTLQRIASISATDGQTRFALWHMAAQGVAERPLVGWGQEGFNYIFNKYYDPALYEQEQWFDRAHNAFIDWLTAGGVPAFLLYLSLFAAAFWLLWRSSELSRAERIALTAALTGYAVHNLFVFDNLYSYVYFFAILALVDSQVARPIRWMEEASVIDAETGITYVLPIATVIGIALVWGVNVPGMRAAAQLITAISPSTSGVPGNIATFEDLVSRPSFAGQEIREQLVSFASSVAQSSEVPDADKQRVTSLAITEMQKQVAFQPLDAREYLQLSLAYRSSGNKTEALKQIEKALALSPKKEQIWIQAGAMAWDLGDPKAAQAAFTAAYDLGPQFNDLAAYAAAGDIGAGDMAAADKVLLKAFGTTTVDNDILGVAYYRAKAWNRLIAMWQLRTNAPTADAQTWFGLASAYYVSGNTAQAAAILKQAAVRFPDAAASVKAALDQIQGAR